VRGALQEPRRGLCQPLGVFCNEGYAKVSDRGASIAEHNTSTVLLRVIISPETFGIPS
jgi:hypothetical protein